MVGTCRVPETISRSSVKDWYPSAVPSTRSVCVPCGTFAKTKPPFESVWVLSRTDADERAWNRFLRARVDDDAGYRPVGLDADRVRVHAPRKRYDRDQPGEQGERCDEGPNPFSFGPFRGEGPPRPLQNLRGG